MAVEIGKEYKNGIGERVTIRCETKDNPDWLCSTQANWYEKATGRFLWYDPVKGTHSPAKAESCIHDLVLG